MKAAGFHVFFCRHRDMYKGFIHIIESTKHRKLYRTTCLRINIIIYRTPQKTKIIMGNIRISADSNKNTNGICELLPKNMNEQGQKLQTSKAKIVVNPQKNEGKTGKTGKKETKHTEK